MNQTISPNDTTLLIANGQANKSSYRSSDPSAPLILPSAQHIEDIQEVSADDLKRIVSLDHFSHGNNKTADIPELLISNSPSPPDYPINRTTWGNADDIPTRVPSAALEDFPPLVRCRDGPAMGYSGDYIDMDESVLSDLSFSFLLNADYDEHDENASDTEGESPESSLSSCKESMVRVAESKDDESCSLISPASSVILQPSTFGYSALL